MKTHIYNKSWSRKKTRNIKFESPPTPSKKYFFSSSAVFAVMWWNGQRRQAQLNMKEKNLISFSFEERDTKRMIDLLVKLSRTE